MVPKAKRVKKRKKKTQDTLNPNENEKQCIEKDEYSVFCVNVTGVFHEATVQLSPHFPLIFHNTCLLLLLTED